MKRSLQQDHSNEISDEPPCKKRRELIHYKQNEIDNSSFFGNSNHCDVVFCIPKNLSDTDQSGDNESDEMEDIDFEASGDYVEYPCFKICFAMNSKYFETILYKNEKVDGKTKINLDDLDCDTFEFLRDWCCPNKTSKFNANNVLNILRSSFKYEMNTLFNQCIDYIRK